MHVKSTRRLTNKQIGVVLGVSGSQAGKYVSGEHIPERHDVVERAETAFGIRPTTWTEKT